MTLSVVLTKNEADFLQFSREKPKMRKIFLPFCFFPTDRKYGRLYVERKLSLRPLEKTSPSMLRIATSPDRRGLGIPRKVFGFARGSPTRGAVERSETERLYRGTPILQTGILYLFSLPYILSVGKKQNGRKIGPFFRFYRENCKKSALIFVKMTEIVILSSLNGPAEHGKMRVTTL